MLNQTEFVIYKHDSQYSVTECSNSGVRRVFIINGCVSGDREVLLRLSQMKPENITIEKYLEKNSGSMILKAG
jgi:hypothetical protein